jgi:hypothetical protein
VVGAPDAVDPPPDGRRVEAAPELPPPQAATSSVAMIAATTAPQCRIFIFLQERKRSNRWWSRTDTAAQTAHRKGAWKVDLAAAR